MVDYFKSPQIQVLMDLICGMSVKDIEHSND